MSKTRTALMICIIATCGVHVFAQGLPTLKSDQILFGGPSIEQDPGLTFVDSSLVVEVKAGSPNTPALEVRRWQEGIAPYPLRTMLIWNPGDRPGGSDYQNEVQLSLRAGTSADHRRYLRFEHYSGATQYLFGVNKYGTLIAFDADDALHRMWFVSGGETRLNSGGAGKFIINQGDAENTGTGGFEVQDGGTTPSTILRAGVSEHDVEIFKVDGSTKWLRMDESLNQLQITDDGKFYEEGGSGLTINKEDARILLNDNNSTDRAADIALQTSGGAWHIGNGYRGGTSPDFFIGRDGVNGDPRLQLTRDGGWLKLPAYTKEHTGKLGALAAFQDADGTIIRASWSAVRDSLAAYADDRLSIYTINDSTCFAFVNGAMKPDTICIEAGGSGAGRINELKAAKSGNGIDNANFTQHWQWNTLSGNGLYLTSNGPSASGNQQKLLNVSVSGANLNSTQTTYAAYVNNSHSGTTSRNYGIYATVSNGSAWNRAIYGTATGTNANAIYGQVTTGTGVTGYSTSSGVGLFGYSELDRAFIARGAVANEMVLYTGNSDTVDIVLNLNKSTSGTPGDGMGAGIQFEAQTNTSIGTTGQINSYWTDIRNATRTSAMDFYTTESGTSSRKMRIAGNGDVDIEGNILPATDDTYYIGKNDTENPQAYKGIILKDQVTGAYYRLEVQAGVLKVVGVDE